MDNIHITEQALEEDLFFEVRPLQTISIEVSLAQTNLYRENNDFIIIFHTNSKLTLHNFFIGEELRIYPKILFPTGENFSGYALIALLEPSFLKKGFLAGSRDAPAGSIIDYVKTKRENEEKDSWHITDSLYIPPQSTQRQSTTFPIVEDDNVPHFYKEIQAAFFSPKIVEEKNVEEEIFHAEDSEDMEELRDLAEDEDIYDEDIIENEDELEEERRHLDGYILGQENIDAGYRIIEVNNDTSLLETMAMGQYGFLTMTYYGGFNYILGEGIEVEEGDTAEDYFSYTLETEQGEELEGGVYIYISRKNNRNIFEYSASEVE